MKNVRCVIGANFGDEGKGLMTDYFCKDTNKTVVVLHNGGAQRGHTVDTEDGKHHVFRHFGSGTFRGAYTYFADSFIVNPILFREEWEELTAIGIQPKVYINKNCRFTTLYDMLINQVIENDRGISKHGSCGTGIFETLYRNQYGVKFTNEITIKPLAMTVGEYYHLPFLARVDFLDEIRKYYVDKRLNEFGLKKDNELLQILSRRHAIIHFDEDFDFMMEHCMFADDEILKDADNVIFEGGQGLLLDQNNMDYFPHLTPSNTGFQNPSKILSSIGFQEEVEVCYVSRTYMTRHGVGRFDSECAKEEINKNMVDLTNVPNPFQDTLRYGKLNNKQLVDRCKKDILDNINYNIPIINLTIALTHMNEYGTFDLPDGTAYISTGKTANDIIKINSIKA